MPTTEREALKAAIAASKQVITRRPSPLDVDDELANILDEQRKGK